MDELIGKMLGQYEIKEKVGQGGMASVFRAYQKTLDRFVAIKVLSPLMATETGFTERFQREAHSVARLNHPNILQVYDSGLQDNYNYIVMRYVENSTTLGSLMKQKAPMDKLISYIIQVADALNYAHEQGIIHRDIKPGNILISGKWALLADFGLVKDRTSDSELTSTGTGMGTPAYMSPEQARGVGVDHRTDIYALGVILHKVLTGSVPHKADTPLAIMLKRTTEPVSSLRQTNPTISQSLDYVTVRSLATDPNKRYRTAALFAEALQRAKDDPSYKDKDDEATAVDVEMTMASTGIGADIEATMASMSTEQATAVDHTPKKVIKPQVAEEKRKSNTVVMIAIAVAVLLLFGVVGYFIFGGNTTQLPTPVPVAVEVKDKEHEDKDTPTLAPITPQAVAKIKVEVRSGPGDNYELLSFLPDGATATIVGQDETGKWWQIKFALSGEDVLGWIRAGAEFVDVTNTGSVAIVLAPPTLTTTPTTTPTPTETNTPKPPTSTPTATKTPLPTPTSPPKNTPPSSNGDNNHEDTPEGEFTLIKPTLDEPMIFGVAEFVWRYSGDLPDEQGFEVRVWRDGEPPSGVHNSVLDNKNGTVAKIDDNSYRLIVDISDARGVRKRGGDYNWAVYLVQIDPEYKELGVVSPPGLLHYEPPGEGGGGSGGGGGGASGR